MWSIKIAMSGRRSRARQLLLAFPTLRRLQLAFDTTCLDMRELLLPVCLDRIVSVVQAELGDIVYVELPEVGSEVKKGEQFGVIESVKVICCKLPYSLSQVCMS